MQRVSTLITIALISAVASATAPEAHAQGVCGEWEVVPTPIPVTGDLGGSQFRDVVSIAPNDAWAAGTCFVRLTSGGRTELGRVVRLR